MTAPIVTWMSASHRHYIVVAMAYLLIALLLVAPVITSITTAIPGSDIAAVDGWQNVWNLWWVHHALANGQNPYHTDLLFYPQGADLYIQTLAIVNGLIALPVTALWGPVAAYNTILVLSLLLSGLAAYGLALHVSGNRRASAISGLLLLCSPYLMTRVSDGQLELTALHWPVLYMLFLVRFVEAGRRRDAGLAGVLLALTGLTSWYYLFFMALVTAGVLLLWLPGNSIAWRPLVAGLALLALIAMTLLLPVLGPVLSVSLLDSGNLARPTPEEVVQRSVNLLDPLLPSYLHPLWGDPIRTFVKDRWHDYSGDWNAALGYGVLLLAALGTARAWSVSWRWLVIAAGALLFALGPELQIGTWRTGIPLPYALIQHLPGLSFGRRPVLFVAVVGMALIPPVALGMRVLGNAITRLRRPWLWALPAVLLVFEVTPQAPALYPAAMHPIYAMLNTAPGAILEMPAGAYKYVEPQRTQLIHARPIVGGYLARTPEYQWPNILPAVRPLWKMRPDRSERFLTGSAGPLEALAASGITTIVVRWDQIAPERHSAVQQAIDQALPGLAPRYADATLSLYQVPAGSDQPVAALTGDGWNWPEEADGSRWQWMGARGDLVIMNSGATTRHFTLALSAFSYDRPRTVALTLNGAPAGHWYVTPEMTSIQFHFWLPPGVHRLSLNAPAEREAIAGSTRQLSIAIQKAVVSVEGS